MRTLVLHHVLLKCKAELGQFAQCLNSLGVLEEVKSHPELFRDYFLANAVPPLAAGIYLSVFFVALNIFTRTSYVHIYKYNIGL